MTELKIKTVEWFDDRWYKINFEIEETSQDVYLPSTTTKLQIIAKPFLAKWRGDIGNREADLRVFEASERGIRIHAAWEVMTTDGIVIYQPHQRPVYTESEINQFESDSMGNLAIIRYQDEMVDLWKLHRWLEIVKPKIIFSEKIVYSLTKKDAGTMDNLLYLEAGEYPINGKTPLKLPAGLYVVDLKTGNQVDDNAFMQTADYAKCAEEMGLGEIIGTLILHTGSKVRTGIEGLATLYRSKEQMEEDYQDFRLAAALWERKHADATPQLYEFPSLLTLRKELENVKKS